MMWNPVTGCTKVSPACRNCYAERIAKRLAAQGAPGYARGFELTLHPGRLDQPSRRRKPAFYFVNSMSDLFHAGVPDDFLDAVMAVMRKTPQHTYMALTKRASRLPVYFAARACPPNLWLGVTVEDRAHGLPRMDWLRQVDARVRMVNMEPLLEDLGELDLSGMDWVSLGGESGPGARPMKEEWVLRVRDQALAARVPFTFRQWGEWGPDGVRRGRRANGRLLEGRVWDDGPRVEAVQITGDENTPGEKQLGLGF
jgi:protein gp37